MDQPLQWREIYAIGHPRLDTDHRLLIDAINAVCAACKQECEPSELQKLLDVLQEITKEHFENENVVLREIISKTGQPSAVVKAISKAVLRDHIDEHERLLAHLQSIICASSLDTSSARTRLCEELRAWFIDHAIKSDADLKSAFQIMQGTSLLS